MTKRAFNLKSHVRWTVLGVLAIGMVVVACGRGNDVTENGPDTAVGTAISTKGAGMTATIPVPSSTPVPATDIPVPTATPTPEPSFSERLLIALEDMPSSCISRPIEDVGCGVDQNPFMLWNPADTTCVFDLYDDPSNVDSEIRTASGAAYTVSEAAMEAPANAWFVAFELVSAEDVNAVINDWHASGKFDAFWLYQQDNFLVLSGGDFYADEARCFSSLQELIQAEGAFTTSPQVELKGFNYTLQDTGDGWSEGSLRFAIENGGYFPLYLDSLDFTRGKAVLETLEGPTYPVALRREDGIRGNAAVIAGPIPPRFAIRGGSGPDLILSWKSATAATPTRIVFPDYPWLELPIPTRQNLGYTSSYSSITFPAIDHAQGLKLMDNPQGLEVTLNGNCRPIELSLRQDAIALAVDFKNNDLFQGANIRDSFQATQISVLGKSSGRQSYRDSIYGYDANGDSLYQIGPGQSVVGEVLVQGDIGRRFDADSLIVFWLPDGSFKIFDLAECLAGRN